MPRSDPLREQDNPRDRIKHPQRPSRPLTPVYPRGGVVGRSRLHGVFGAAGLLGGVVVLGSCVPIGGWLYDDPTFVLSELTVRGKGNPSDTLEMVLTACNRNDFPVQATGIEVSLEMQGTSLGSAQSSQNITLATRDSTKLTVPLAISAEAREAPGRLSFILTGHTTLQTPIGERRVELFQRGAVALKPTDEVAHIERAGRPCRPGRSTLPGYMPPRLVIPPSTPAPMPTSAPGGAQPQ